MKNKNLIIIIVFVIIIVLAGVLFFAKGKKALPETSSTNPAMENQTQDKAGIKESLMGLLQSTSGVKCSITDENGSYIVIAKGDRARIEGIKSINPQTQKEEKGNMISDGTWAYIWTGKQGIKINIKETEESSSAATKQSEESTDWKNWAKEMQESGAKYECNPTVATDADFTPPSDVVFQDLGEMFKNLQQMQSGETVPANQFDPSQFTP